MPAYLCDSEAHPLGLTTFDIADVVLEQAGLTTGTVVITVSSSGTPMAIAVMTRADVPNNDDWEDGNISVDVSINVANMSCEVDVRAHRANSSGAIQESSNYTAVQNAGSTGVLTFSIADAPTAWVAGACGDLLMIEIRNNRVAGAHGSQAITIGLGENDGAGTNDVSTSISEDVAACLGVDFVEVVDEDVNIDETVNTLKAMSRVFENVDVNIGETTPTAMIFARIVDEIENLVEDVTTLKQMIRAIDEDVNIVENITTLKAMFDVTDEDTNINEAIITVLGIVKVVATEQTSIDETIITLKNIISTSDEGVNLVEILVTAAIYARVINETENINEDVVTIKALIREISETVNVSEDVNVAANFARVVDDTVNITESIISSLGFVREISDAINLNETILAFRGLVRIANEVQNITENIVITLGLVRQLSEPENIVESITTALDYVRIKNEIAEIRETVIVAANFVRVSNLEQTNVIEALVIKLRPRRDFRQKTSAEIATSEQGYTAEQQIIKNSAIITENKFTAS